MINYDEIRKKVAIHHNFLLDKDDPLLMAASMHEEIIIRYVQLLNEQNETLQKKLIDVLQQGNTEAKATASRIITESAKYVSDQISETIGTEIKEGRAELRKDLRLAWGKIEAARKVAFVAAGVSCVSAAIMLGSMLTVA